MPFGGRNLGFPYLFWLVVLSAFTVIGFVVRRRWRIWVARSEEIERLLVLASEETARVELEASVGYSVPVPETISRPLQHQCAVCFCPTTTRCSRCKAVRYCSGKCQIIHWRQGHRYDCIPFTADQNSDDGVFTSKNVLRKEENKIPDKSFESEGSPDEPAYSKSDCLHEGSRGSDHGSDLECLADGKDTSSSSDENENSEDYLSAGNLSDNLNRLKPDYPHHDAHCRSSSSGWSVDGSNHSPSSDPSTPSGFWEGAIDSSRSRVHVHDDSSSNNSSVDGDADIHRSHASRSFSTDYDRNVSLPEPSYGAKTFIAHDARLSALKIKKPTILPVLSERSDNAPKSRISSLSSPEKFNHVNVSASEPALKFGLSRYSSSGGHASLTARSGGSPVAKLASEVSTTQPLHPDSSNNMVNDKSTSSQTLKDKESGIASSVSAVPLSSSTRRHSIKGANSGKVDSACAVGNLENKKASPNVGNVLKTSMQKTVDQLRVPKSSRHNLSGLVCSTAGRYNDKGLFPYEQFVKLYHWNKAELRPTGLINCGNSCYANAVLQCLACTPPLTAYFLEGLHSKTCERNTWCFTCELESLIQKANGGTSPLSPIRIVSQIQKIGTHLSNGREEDAHEFLRYAIDLMQSSCLKKARINASSSGEEETTLIGLTFGGYLRSKIKCMKCGGKSERHEKMMDLNVEIQGDIETLEEALRQFTGTEILDGDNKYQCSRCRSYEKAKKKLTVLEAPNILTIALKRFQSGNFGKLNKSIRFPEILNLAPYMSRTSDKSPIYRLYGVVVHLDINNAAFSGHYVCYVKNIQNKWFKIDDSVVKSVELESVLTKKAYMLLYARCSPRAPRVIRNSIVPPDPKKPKNPMSKSRPHHTCPWGASGSEGAESLYPNRTSFQQIRTVVEEDSSSDNSSFFSEGCSCSTESSNRDSSADDFFDHIFGDQGQHWNSLWKSSSDSDSSSSSSSSSPFPMFSDSGKCRNLVSSDGSSRNHNPDGLELANNNPYGETFRRSWR